MNITGQVKNRISKLIHQQLSTQLVEGKPLHHFANQLADKHELAHKAVIKLHQLANPNHTVLFVTATAQAEANYYLIWQLFKINQRHIPHIVIISTDFSKKRGFVHNLINLLSLPPFNLSAELISQLHIPDGKEEEDVDYIKSLINDWLMIHQPSEVIFNITGGTKLISIAQDQVAHLSANYHCVYQGRNNKLTWYNHIDQDSRLEQLVIPEDINARLHGKGYIKQKGTSILSHAGRDYVSMLHSFMEQDFDKARSFISYINYLCSECRTHTGNSEDYPYTITVNKNNADTYGEWLVALAEVDQTYFRYLPDSRELVFLSKQGMQFMNGEWFELLVGYFIFLHFNQLGKQVDVQVGLEFKKTGHKKKIKSSDGNEIDVAFMQANGYLNFMECKTVNWGSKDKPTTMVNEKLHKLSSISKVAGLNSHIYFVSLYGLSPQSMKVASEQNIRVICGRQLLEFAKELVTD